MERSYFGTDGIRGPYGSAHMCEAFAWRLGAAAAKFAAKNFGRGRTQVFIGRDTRGSGPGLERALAAGVASAGLQPVSLGVIPSPAVSLVTREQGGALGVVVTASHNPASDNGIKFFDPSGVKLTDEQECGIERLLPAAAPAGIEKAPEVSETYDGAGAYVEKALAVLAPKALAGWSIVLDTANGAAFRTSRAAFEQLGANLELIGNAPDGTNINAGVGSQHPEKMCELVRKTGAKIGVAHDGDADRCILCDERGDVLDGDEILTLLALRALKLGTLSAKTLVVTVQSNLGVDAAIAEAGGRVCRTSVGDRYVIERMQAEGANLGGESSGHVICTDVSSTGDGLVAAMKVIEVMLATGEPLSKLRRALRKFPQLTDALKVRAKKPLEELPKLTAAISAVEERLGARGRVLVRYSGTESKLRLLVEGPTEEDVRHGLAELDAAARTELDVL